MRKISAIAGAMLVVLVFGFASYFFLLVISFNQWEIVALNHLYGWLFTSRSGLGSLFCLFVLALWPHRERGERPRNIIRRIPQNEQQSKSK